MQDSLQVGIRDWWEDNPMAYDWEGTNSYAPGSPEFYVEIDNRFWKAAWFAHQPGEEPFSRLIDYSSLKGKRVLEIGCGAGALSSQLAKHGARLNAVDLTENAVKLTRRRFELRGLDGDIRRMDAERLEFPEETFDFVWSWGVIHHSANTEAIIEQIHRVLKPGGQVSVMVYYRKSIVYLLGHVFIRGVLMGKLLKQSAQEIANQYTDGLIAKYYTREDFAGKFNHFATVETEVMGQKVEVWQLPAGQVKDMLIKLTPDGIARWLTDRYGMYLFLTATK